MCFSSRAVTTPGLARVSRLKNSASFPTTIQPHNTKVKVINFSQQLGRRTSMFGSTMRLLVVALGAVALTVSAQNQRQDFSKVEIKITPIAGNIHLLEGSGGNVTVSSGADGTLIVDTQFLPLAEKIDAALTTLNPKPLQYVINTHVHGDHVGGNPYFGKKARIIAT